jgi:hypothetical protein
VSLLDETKNEVTVVAKPEVIQVGPISNGSSRRLGSDRSAWHPYITSSPEVVHLDEKRAFPQMCAGEYTRKKLCHNCDTKPAFAAQTDFFDRSHLLILRKLLKTQMCSKIPAYRLARHKQLCLASFGVVVTTFTSVAAQLYMV